MKNEILLYDSSCPLCSAYTKAFQRFGILNPDGRKCFRDVSLTGFEKLDTDRARHQIPLVDQNTGDVRYGIDALILLLGRRFPLIEAVMKIQAMYRFFSRLYNFISYNRRIIISAKPVGGFDCAPDFNLRQRRNLIVFCTVVSALITAWIGNTLGEELTVSGGWWKMLLIAGTGWVAHALIRIPRSEKGWDYLGHTSVVMLLGVLVLLPALFISLFTMQLHLQLAVGSMIASSSLMLWQHSVRVTRLRLPIKYTIVWFALLQVAAAIWFIILNPF